MPFFLLFFPLASLGGVLSTVAHAPRVPVLTTAPTASPTTSTTSSTSTTTAATLEAALGCALVCVVGTKGGSRILFLRGVVRLPPDLKRFPAQLLPVQHKDGLVTTGFLGKSDEAEPFALVALVGVTHHVHLDDCSIRTEQLKKRTASQAQAL